MSEPSKPTSDQSSSDVDRSEIEDAVVVTEDQDPTENDGDAAPVEDTPSLVPAPVEQTVIVEKLGFGRLIFGGAAAAGLGFLGAWLGLAEGRTDPAEQLAAQAAQIEALEAELAELASAPAPEAPDLSPLSEGVDAANAAIEEVRGEVTTLSDALAGVQEGIGGFEERLTAVERQPGEDGQVTDTAIASFERELDELRGQLSGISETTQAEVQAAQAALAAARAETEAAAEAARQEVAAAAAQAEADAAAAQAEAERATGQAAVSQLRLALDAGEPFDEQITTLADLGIEVPETLAAMAADGLPTAQDLQSNFPDAARAALAAARDSGEGASEEEGGFGSFFRDQLGVRSTEPREGNSADAVLSRAEASVRGGDLTTALTEIEALPDSAKTALQGWLDQAQARADALSAADMLEQQLNNE